MGNRIIVGNLDQGNGVECAIFYDSVTDVVFGPLMTDLEEAESFEEWLPKDARKYKVEELIKLLKKFRDFRIDEKGS